MVPPIDMSSRGSECESRDLPKLQSLPCVGCFCNLSRFLGSLRSLGMTYRGVARVVRTGYICNASGTAHRPFPTVSLEGFTSASVVPTMHNAVPPRHPLASPFGRGGRAQARTERVNVEDLGGRYHLKKRPKALSVSAAPSQLSQRESQEPAGGFPSPKGKVLEILFYFVTKMTKQ